MTDRERTTADELARLTEDDVVRRELDRRNRQLLVALLVAFPALSIAVLIGESFEGPVPRAVVATVMVNLAVNLIGIAAVRRTRHPIGGWVLAFCVLQFLIVMQQPLSWAIGGLLALLYSRFRLGTAASIGINVFIAVVIAFASTQHPMRSPSAHFTAEGVTRGVVIVNLFVIAAACALQILGTRRVRAEILDEWREPLRNAREQVRMRDELQYARQMQLAMLPEGPPRLDWIDLAATSIPAAEVGGDYYDFFADGEQLAIVACDVAGHGMQSGLVLAAMRGALIATAKRTLEPAELLAELHDLVAHASRKRMLAAALVVLFDRQRNQATIASAAHPPLILRRGNDTRLLEAFAPPLGVRLPFAAGSQTIELEPGDVFVLHSDGVYESRNAADEEYGLERLRQLVANQPANVTAEALRDAIVRDAERFRGRAQDDDVTVVVARIAPHDRIGAAWI